MKHYRFILVLLSVSFMLNSCKDNEPIIGSNQPRYSFGPDNGLTYDDIINYYSTGIDSNDIIGEIYIHNLNQSLLNDEMSLLQSHTNSARISFFGRNDSAYIFGNSFLNQQQFTEEYPGSYWARGDENSMQGLQLLFGAGNLFQLGATAISNPIDTVIYIFNAPDIINIQTGDSISKSNDFNVKWNSSSTRYVNISLTQAYSDSSSSAIISASCFLDNNGNYVFPSSQLSAFPNGMYNITITYFIPYFLYDNLGGIVLVTLKSQNSKTIIIKD